MPTYSWGTTGTTGELRTSTPGNGWVTFALPMPDVRVAYNRSRAIHVKEVVAIVGTGNRQYYYRTGRSGWVYTTDGDGGTHLITDDSTFDFRVAKGTAGGTAVIGWRKNSDYVTEWLNGDPVGRGVQPGRMTYYQVPSAPGTTVVASITTVGEMSIGISAPEDDGGTPITGYRHQIATDAAFENVIAEWTSTGGTLRSGVPTRRTLFTRSLAMNLVTDNAGFKGGAASTTRSFILGTPVVNAPGINAVSTASGRQTLVTLTPPTNNGGLAVQSYETQVQYLSPSPIPTPSTRTLTHTGVTLTVTAQSPGASYRYRSRARNVMGFGPYSAWITVAQSRPSFNPGDYFDGSTAAESDTTYAWTGTVNNSISTATSPGVLGWQVNSGINVVLAQATGGLVGTKSVRVVVKSDQPDVIRVGQRNDATFRSTVLPSQRYTGSIMVRIPRVQRMVAEIAWLDSTGTFISYSIGTPLMIAENTTVTLTVAADSPDNAAFAVVRARDYIMSGWVPWKSGEMFVVDGAMLSFGGPYPYFDGSFPAKGNYTYEWAGTPNNSISARHTVETFVNPLVDPDCIVVPAAPRPPVVPNYCIEEVGIWRRIWYRINAESVAEFFSTIPIIQITTGAQAERQIRLRFYANPFGREMIDLPANDFCAEQIISYLPANTVLTLDGVSQSAWASVAGGDTLNADHLIYGSDGMPGTWPVLECGIDYFIAVDVPPENADGNVTLSFDMVVQY